MKQMDTLRMKNGNRDLIFASTDKNKNVLEQYTKLWGEIKYLVKRWKDVGKMINIEKIS